MTPGLRTNADGQLLFFQRRRSSSRARFWPSLATLVCLAYAPAQVPGADAEQFFESRIRPTLVERCGACHGPATKMAGLTLTTREGLFQGSANGPVVVPREPEASKLLQAVRYQGELKMPPTGQLADSEIQALSEWIEMGAPWPEESGRTDAQIKGGSGHWAFDPVTDPKPPVVSDHEWVRGPIDHFILSRLEAEGLEPSPRADPHTLLRRIHFDLTGLPPTLDVIESFAEDPSPDAYQRLVDQLLDRPEFGEHWARRWLDVTYFADTLGIGRRLPATDAWRYRDYVIDAFNQDKPLDEFITEQLAGDLLPAESNSHRREQMIATGFLALGPWAMVDADKEKLRMDVVDLQIDMVGKTFLGLSLGCARCHDHKFDPVPQKDYYALAGIFRSTYTVGGRINANMIFSDVHRAKLPEASDDLAARLARLQKHKQTVFEIESRKDDLLCEKDRLKVKLAHLKPPEPEAGESGPAAGEPTPQSDEPGPDKEGPELKKVKEQIADIDKQIQALDGRLVYLRFNEPRAPTAITVYDRQDAADTHVNLRGNPHTLGDQVPRGFVQAALREPAAPITTGSGRLEMARWIASRDNPLTARVYVNRVWRHLFGEGLVRSVDNFGIRGEKPSHPALLDYLAFRFVEQGWSTKKLIRSMVLSRAYQMSSVRNRQSAGSDPENHLLWRMNRRRLDAEVIRDSILQISGELDPSRGGPSLGLNIPGNLFVRAKPEFVQQSLQLPSDLRNRRTVYLPVYRKGQLNTLDILDLFDYPEPGAITGSREATNVPTQALFLLNSPFLRERAQTLARSLVEQEVYEPDRVRRAMLQVFNRPASDGEVDEALDFIFDLERKLQEDKKRGFEGHLEAWTRYCQSLLASSQFLYQL